MEDNHYDIKELLAMAEEARLHFIIAPRGYGRRAYEETQEERNIYPYGKAELIQD